MTQVRTKSEFSFLTGLSSVDDYVNKAVGLGNDTVFLTDTGLYGAFDFLKASKSKGIKGVVGLEIKVMDEIAKDGTKKFNSIILYARDYEGYKELIKLVGKSYFEKDDIGMYGNYLSRDDLSGISDKIVGMIPYESGFLSKFLLEKNSEYSKYMDFYKGLFGNNLYIEEQPHKKHLEINIGREINNEEFATFHKYLNTISKKYDVNILPSNYTLYADIEDKESYDVFNGIGSDMKISDENRNSFLKEDHSYKSNEEMSVIFGPKMENIDEFSKKFEEYSIPNINVFPFVHLDDETEKLHKEYETKYNKMESQEFFVRYKTYVGLFNRLDKKLTNQELLSLISKKPDKVLDLKNKKYSFEEIQEISKQNGPKRQELINSFDDYTKKLLAQIDYELLVVDGMGFNGYFLIVEDYINYCKNLGIPVGPGRGSAAGALIAYALGITDVDPIKHELLFERFLNPDRVSQPDIDSDFDPHFRDKIIDYVRSKYGKENVSEVATFGTMAAKSAIKDVGKFYGENFQSMNRFAKQLPSRPGVKIKDMFTESRFFKESYEGNVKIKKIVDTAMKLEKTKKQLGVHACAVMISPEPLTNFTALQYSDSGKIITQLEAHNLEDLGLLKMDFLGLENLSIINETVNTVKKLGLSVKEKTNKFGLVDMLKIDYEDPETYKTIFSEGNTTGVFQFESPGMRDNLKNLKSDRFDDIVAMVALYRPGPMAFIPSYIKRKHGKEKIEYLNPVLEPIMNKTYGHCVYQEQIIKMVQIYAGYSAGEADILRRAIGKKKKDVIEQQKSVFIEKGIGMNRDPAEAKKIFELVIEPAADYSFNKSHAVSYAMVSFQTAYLKTHYTLPFFQALLNSKLEGNAKIQEKIGEIANELKDIGIKITNPNINECNGNFEATNEGYIKFGLKCIKSLSGKGIDAIIQEREANGKFKDFNDFVVRLPKEAQSKAVIESLISSGALDMFGDRAEMLPLISKIVGFKKTEVKEQVSLFDMQIEGGNKIDHKNWLLAGVYKIHPIEKIEMEKKYLGYYFNRNPITDMTPYFTKNKIDAKSVIKSLELNQKLDKKDDKQDISITGYVEDKFDYMNRQGKKVTIVKCSSYDYTFEVNIDHGMIQEDQILIGNILTINEKYIRKDDNKNKFFIKNPFNFESLSYKTFEDMVNLTLPENKEVKNIAKIKTGIKN